MGQFRFEGTSVYIRNERHFRVLSSFACVSHNQQRAAPPFLMFKTDAWLNVSFPYKPICFKCKAPSCTVKSDDEGRNGVREAKKTERRKRKKKRRRRRKRKKKKRKTRSRRNELVRAETSLKSFSEGLTLQRDR